MSEEARPEDNGTVEGWKPLVPEYRTDLFERTLYLAKNTLEYFYDLAKQVVDLVRQTLGVDIQIEVKDGTVGPLGDPIVGQKPSQQAAPVKHDT